MKSAGDTSEYNTRTWRDYHARVDWIRLGLPQDCEALPLTPVRITIVGAILKEADYRSARNYMSAIKGDHIIARHRRAEQLEQSASRFNTSTTRGMGPTRQREPLSVGKLVALDANRVINNPKYPIKAGWCIL